MCVRGKTWRGKGYQRKRGSERDRERKRYTRIHMKYTVTCTSTAMCSKIEHPRESWLIHVIRDPFTCVSFTTCWQHDQYLHSTWLIDTCQDLCKWGMTYLPTCLLQRIYNTTNTHLGTWRIYITHDSFTSVFWRRVRSTTNPYMVHDSFIWVVNHLPARLFQRVYSTT